MKKIFVVAATIFAVLATMGTQGICQEEGINACYKKMNGQLRLVDDPDRCRPSEASASLVSREEFEALVAKVEDCECNEGGPVTSCQDVVVTCEDDGNCDGAYQESICADKSLCMGFRIEAECSGTICIPRVVNDDSACGTNVLACDCPGQDAVFCTGEVDQIPPSCPTN